MDHADIAYVYFNPDTIKHKKLEEISSEQVQQSFVRDVDSVVQKLNTTFQQDIKEEAEALALFLA